MSETFQTWWQALSDWAAGTTITWVDLMVSGIILVVVIALAFVFSRLLSRLLLRAARFSAGDLDDTIISALRGPVTVLIILAGAYVAITVPLTLSNAVQDAVNRAAALAAIFTGAYLINSVGSAVLLWLEEHLENNDVSSAGGWALPLARRGMLIVVIAMAAMISLDVLGVNISPLIAGLGLGGLAVALALQPTLSNLFAGTYVITEGVVSEGDYVEMENGVTGYVVDVNWRSTRLRTWGNNLVVIPNSRFAETIITNYSKPNEHVNVYLTCGVAYESDLRQVEAVSMEVMRQVERDHPGVVKDYGVYFGYDTFGESNVDFWLFMQSSSRLDSFEVRTELIKQLHARLIDEGITINYPVRALRFPDGWTPDGQMPGGGQASRRTARPRPEPQPQAHLPDDAPGGAGDGPDI
ncbi:MAG: mechanosensitive ion channel family protein [Chloroflexota bacterium]|nr:mechanosensitive ion channel family protein [Chloroflexota bacterium]